MRPETFTDESSLKAVFPGFERREGQRQLARAAAESFEQGGVLVCEAGTGTGKTLAYLIPLIEQARRGEQRVLVSTDTKTLQAQVLKKELPVVEKLLGEKIRAEVCLGAGNYLCKRKWQRRRSSAAGRSESKSDWYRKFSDWEAKTSTGILSEFAGPTPPGFLAQVAREGETCLGPKCPNYSTSHYFVAREKWRRAELLIVNHSLLSRHLLAENGLLPEFQCAVIDEAHRFADTFNAQCEQEFHIKGLLALAADFPWPVPGLRDSATTLLASLQHRPSGKRARMKEALVAEGADDLLDVLRELQADLKKEQDVTANLFGEEVEPGERALRLAILSTRLQSAADILDRFCGGPTRQDVLSLQVDRDDARFTITPIDVSERIAELFVATTHSILFCSATLTVQGSMEYFLARNGLHGHGRRVKTLLLTSPFDYRHRALLYVPRELPEPAPGDSRFEDACAAEILRLLTLSQGGALVVFSSIRSLQALEGRIRSLPFPVFSSIADGAERALDRFRQTPDAVLLGLESYRQGMDVQGDRLRLVVIVRLPFPVPDDPLLEARMEREKEKGANPFMTLQLPEMVLKMRQGFGRLIRSSSDRGVVAILDPRVITRSYGRILTESLPPARRCHRFDELQSAWKELFGESA